MLFNYDYNDKFPDIFTFINIKIFLKNLKIELKLNTV